MASVRLSLCRANRPIQLDHYPAFCSTRGISIPPVLGGIVVHHMITPSVKFTSTHLYSGMERGTEIRG